MITILTIRQVEALELPEVIERWGIWDHTQGLPDLQECERLKLNLVVRVPLPAKAVYSSLGFRMHQHGHEVDTLFWQFGCNFWG